jgi:hypothetical protein
MSAPGKPDLAQDWRTALKIRDDEIDRLAHASDEDFQRSMAELPEPSRIPTIEEITGGRGVEGGSPNLDGPVRAVDVYEERTRISPVVWLLAAAFALVLAASIVSRSAVIAFFKGPLHEPGPEPTPNPESPQLTPVQQAEVARVDAAKTCDQGQWLSCRDKLDQARDLDPAGDTAPSVQEMRSRISAGLQANLKDDKPPK